MKYRTHTCGELRDTHLDQTVTLSGWVNNYRDHGGVRFIDLRDRDGITQIVFHPEAADAHAVAQKLRREDVITVTGTCIFRSAARTRSSPPAKSKSTRPRPWCSTTAKTRRSSPTKPTRSAKRHGCATATSTSAARRCSTSSRPVTA